MAHGLQVVRHNVVVKLRKCHTMSKVLKQSLAIAKFRGVLTEPIGLNTTRVLALSVATVVFAGKPATYKHLKIFNAFTRVD